MPIQFLPNRLRSTVLFSLVFVVSLSAQNKPILLKDSLFYTQSMRANMRHIADSLQKAYKNRDTNVVYWSIPQAEASHVRLDSMADAAIAFLRYNPSLESFLYRFPYAHVTPDLRIRREYESWFGQKIKFLTTQGSYIYQPFDTALWAKDLKNQWVYTVNKANEYRPNDELEAYFFNSSFISQKIPEKYNPMIQYADYLVDTNNIYSFYIKNFDEINSIPLPARKALYAVLFPKEKRIRPSGFFWDIDWMEQRLEDIDFDQQLLNDPNHKALLLAAIEEGIQKQVASQFLANLAYQYFSPTLALQLKRLRTPNFSCGNDNYPRFQALDIARLAAELHDWPVFITSHLFLFRFGFDGYDKPEECRVYSRELELLDIDVPTLLFGAHLWRNHTAKNQFHFYGTHEVTNKSVVYMADFERFISMTKSAIADSDLDDYNRYHCWEMLRQIWASQLFCARDREKNAQLKTQIEIETKQVLRTLPERWTVDGRR
jgi:hypothetical protein